MSDRHNQRTKVVSRHGTHRFQTGMITATLLGRGLPMARAFSVSKQLRQRIQDRAKITTDELETELDALLVELDLGAYVQVEVPPAEASDPLVITGVDGPRTFARHVLLRDLAAIGLEPERASDVLREVVAAGRRHEQLDMPQLDELMAEILGGFGPQTPRRYRLLRWIRSVDKQVVIFIGGATGTGKSTLAMELAFRLGIRIAVSTDMIRETMRTVLSPEVVPGLHDHSFRGMLQGGNVLSEPQERVLAGYRQQADQVAAGARAVIRRALREGTHLIIEGTHLIPPFSSYLPAGEGVRHGGVMLAVPGVEAHRRRFPQRAARRGSRDPADYLEAFQSVRWIHDDLLALAEDNEILVLATDDVGPAAIAAIDYLSQQLPEPDEPAYRPPEPRRRRSGPSTLLLILDGLADEPHPALDGRTPLAAANIPTLRMLANTAGQGQVLTAMEEGQIPHTDEGLWALVGSEAPNPPIGRGLCEALGGGIPVPPDAIVFRGNMASCDGNGMLVDRRAGRISSGVADLVAQLKTVPLRGGVIGSIRPGHEHRVVVMLQGSGLSAQVIDTDPGGAATIQQVLQPRPTDDSPEAARTAAALRELLEHAHMHLSDHPHNADRVARGLVPANCVITRGAASARVPSLPQADDTAMIAACSTALGVGRLLGMQTVRGPRMTGNLDTDLDSKFAAAAAMLQVRQLVIVHVKGTDIAAHERRPLAKRDFLGRVDEALGRMLREHTEFEGKLRVVVSADHGTSSITGNHLPDPVPVLVATWQGPGDETDFDEDTAAGGALGLLRPGELADMLW